MSNTALNDLIVELRQLDRAAPVFDQMIDAMLAILDAHQIKPATRAPKCSICDRPGLVECVNGWIPNAYTIKRGDHEYTYAVRCKQFTIASKSWPPYNPDKKSKG